MQRIVSYIREIRYELSDEFNLAKCVWCLWRLLFFGCFYNSNKLNISECAAGRHAAVEDCIPFHSCQPKAESEAPVGTNWDAVNMSTRTWLSGECFQHLVGWMPQRSLQESQPSVHVVFPHPYRKILEVKMEAKQWNVWSLPESPPKIRYTQLAFVRKGTFNA